MASIAAGVMAGIGALTSIGGSVAGAVTQSNAASSAAQIQDQAAQSVIQQEGQAATAAEGAVNTATGTGNQTIGTGLTSGNQVISSALANQQAALSPYLAAGTTGLSNVQNELQGLTAPSAQFNFNPTTSPQLQFEQQQANEALARQGAASGTVLGGGTVRASDIMNTGLASTYLNQAFNQSLAQYNTNRQNTLTQLQGNTNLAGLGYNATGALNQDIGTAGLTQNSNIQNASAKQAANTIAAGQYTGQTGLTAAQIEEGATLGAANANSANSLAQGNVWGGLINNLTGVASNQLSGLGNNGGYGPSAPSSSNNGTYGAGPGVAPSYNPSYDPNAVGTNLGGSTSLSDWGY
jgi:hypothetical protein